MQDVLVSQGPLSSLFLFEGNFFFHSCLFFVVSLDLSYFPSTCIKFVAPFVEGKEDSPCNESSQLGLGSQRVDKELDDEVCSLFKFYCNCDDCLCFYVSS